MRKKENQTKKLNFDKFEVARITSSNKVLGGGGTTGGGGGGDTPTSSIKCLHETE